MSNNKNPASENKSMSGLRVPLPAVLMGLGMLASASQLAKAAPSLAVDDNYVVQANSVLSGVNVVDNDSLGNSYSIIALSPPSHGVAILDSFGNLTYTPTSGFAGADSFLYIDQNSNSSAQVNILVSPTPIPALKPAALAGLAGLLAFFGLRRRRD